MVSSVGMHDIWHLIVTTQYGGAISMLSLQLALIGGESELQSGFNVGLSISTSEL